MKLYYKYLAFIISFAFFSLIILISYLIGKKRGIKKALYRITYTSICVIFAFLLSPYVNEYILNYNLYDAGRAIRYNGLHFYRVIDFIEEVIVHSSVLNDIYNIFPSLKDLLMDFPQLLFVPITYILLFIALKFILLPLYLFLSYKRKRRVLYDKEYGNTTKVWAGILTSVQCVFLISIILTPVSGLSRAYKEASKKLVEEDTNLCKQTEYLVKYESACSVVEVYNSSVFGLISNSPINKYIYDSLTRIHYDNLDTTLNNEVVNIARAGIILSDTGLLNAINAENFSDVSELNFNAMSQEDIKIIVNAFEQSVYTREIIYDVYRLSKVYLDSLIGTVGLDYTINYSYEEIIKELEIVLTMINYIMNNNQFLDTINKVYNLVDDFSKLPEHDKNSREKEIRLFFDIVYSLDINSLIEVFTYLQQSQIYNDLVPKMIDKVLSPSGINVTVTNDPEELNNAVIYGLGIAKIIQNHKYIYSIIHLVNDLTSEEIDYIAEAFKYFSNSKTMGSLIFDLINLLLSQENIELEIPTEVIYQIKNWKKELRLVHLVMQIVYTNIDKNYIDYDKAWHILTNYNDTVLFERALKYAISLLPDVFVAWIAGKDYKYLVGEYV